MHIRDLIPWNRKGEAANPLATLQREMNRVFDDYWRRFDGMPMPEFGWTGPRADVRETEGAVEVSVELPGMDEKDVELTVANDVLTIKGEKKAETEQRDKNWYVSERSYGSFLRSIPLPAGVEGDKAEAVFKKGVLTVTVPKSPEAQARVKRIEVKAS